MKKCIRWMAVFLVFCVLGTMAVLAREHLKEGDIQPGDKGELFKREGLPIRFRIPPGLTPEYPETHSEPWSQGEFGIVVEMTTVPPEKVDKIKWVDSTYCLIKLAAYPDDSMYAFPGGNTSLKTWLRERWPPRPDDLEEDIKIDGITGLKRTSYYNTFGDNFLYVQVFIYYEPILYKFTIKSRGEYSYRKKCYEYIQYVLDTTYFDKT